VSTPLEQRYRRVLKLLPSYYRAAWEEDMVSAFLDSATTGDPEMDELSADLGHPSLAEAASVAALAVRLRLGGPTAPPQYYAWGQAVRRAILIVTMMQTAIAAPGLVILLWQTGRIGWLPAPAPILSTAGHPDVWRLPLVLLGYAWFPAFLELLRGHRRAAQLWAVVASLPIAVIAVRSLGGPPHLAPVLTWANLLLLNVLPIAAMAAFHHDAPPISRADWLTALLASFGLIAVPLEVVQYATLTPELADAPGRVFVIVAFLGVLQLVRKLVGRDPVTSSWSLTLALLAADVLLLRVVTLGVYPHDPGMATVGAWEAACMALLGVALAADGTRALRLPGPPSAAGVQNGEQ
jgi:hypothetical protein